VTVIAVRGHDRVGVVHRGGAAHRDGLLPDVDVTEATDLLVLVRLHGAHFELADQQHLAEPVMQLLGGGGGAFGQRPPAAGGGSYGVGHG